MRARQASHGLTIVELLVTTLIMGLISTAMFGMLITTLSTSKRLNNKLDSIDAARSALDKLGRDIRMARNLGDVNSNMVSQSVTIDGVTTVEQAVGGSAVFPSVNNPLYGGGVKQPPEGGASNGPGWPWGISQYDLNASSNRNKLLIIQIPIFDNSGFPTVIPPGTGNINAALLTQSKENVETHIYRLVPDPDPQNAGEYLLQWVKIPGMLPGQSGANPSLMTASNATASGLSAIGYTCRPCQPQTLVSGIVGPLGADGQPRIFQFLAKNQATADDTIRNLNSAGEAQWIANDYQGVAVTMEIRQHKNTSKVGTTYKTPGVLAVKQEVYIRNNSTATSIGMPSTL